MSESDVPRHPWKVRNNITMAQTADVMARECREIGAPPRRLDDAPAFRGLAFRHRKRAREELQ